MIRRADGFLLFAAFLLASLSGCSGQRNSDETKNKQLKRSPIIGINLDTSGSEENPRFVLSSDYVDAISAAGGIPLLLPSVQDAEALKRQVALCDGFVFTGGKDIDPAKYGETPHESGNPLHSRREEYDFALVQEVINRRKPFLAVCLGCQEVNVAMGGTLVQDIPSETSTTIDHKQKAERYELTHSIAITSPSKLANLLKETSISVNSFHHQSCEKPGKNIRFVAQAPDGIVESYELENYPFGLAVQWHPEALTSYSEHLKIYEGLVKAAKRRKR